MPRVLTVDGSVKIGAYRFPDRKKPCLCVEKGNTCTVYGSFIDTDRANEFMNELAGMLEDINPNEIVSHILDGTLLSWLASWKMKSQMLVAFLLENEKARLYEKD